MQCATLPIWIVYLNALATPAVALLAAVIGYRQWRIAKDKLKLDLFERRLMVYEAAKELISSILISGRRDAQQDRNYLVGTRGAVWLFKGEIRKYLDEELWYNATLLEQYEAELEGPLPEPSRTETIQEKTRLKMWLNQQHKVLEAKFAPYLALRH